MRITGSILCAALMCLSCAGQITSSTLTDEDGDGYEASIDCDDLDPSVHPGAVEACADGKDNDCADGDATCPACSAGQVISRCSCGGALADAGFCCGDQHQDNPCGGDVDNDGDGFFESADCDDNDASVNPGAAEICEDGKDNDCSGGDAVCPGETEGIWISPSEVMALPMGGDAWTNVKDEADGSTGTPNLSDQDDSTNVRVMAQALVSVRTGERRYTDDVLAALRVVAYDNTESGGRTLALGRELIAYVIAADLIDLKSVDPRLDADFGDKLRELLTKELGGRTLVSTHEDRPNNWGTHAGASRLAVAVYLGDQAELQRAADVFRGWLGERGAYSEFSYGDLSWQCDSQSPVGVNPAGCTRSGHDIDGVIPDDQRRCGSFGWPPCKTNYAWESLQGALAQAVILHRRGYPAWDWGDQALLRAVAWLHDTAFSDGGNYPAEGDDGWQPWLINHYYCTDFPAPSPSRPGKNVGWTDWTHEGNPACR